MWSVDRDEERKFKFVRIKTHVLKVHIHCQGCMHKVKKLLRKVEGVYDVEIKLGEHKVTVSGKVDCARLIDKLVKSGKHAEIWTPPESNWLNQETCLNKKHQSLMDGHDSFDYHPREENNPDWEFESYLKDKHNPRAFTGGYVWGQDQDIDGDEESVKYSRSDPGVYAPGQFKNIYEATPVYKYQYQVPGAFDNLPGSWHNYYYPAAMGNIDGSWHNHYYPAAMDNIQGLCHNPYYPYSKVYDNTQNMQLMTNNMMQPLNY